MPVEYSIIVPAYKEAGNLKPLVTRVFSALSGDKALSGNVEMVIVDDDSKDGSEEIVKELSVKYNVRILVRRKERGLSSAVIHGFRNCEGTYMLVMDADLQHPPESVPALFKAFKSNNKGEEEVEFVLGTRYGAGMTIDKGWPLHRRVISWGARVLARPLTPLSDPMSGFFGLRRDVFFRGEKDISAIGYKIALELFVKTKVKSHKEVGFSFATRTVGESKLTGKVMIHYLNHLYSLYWFCFGLYLYFALATLCLIMVLLLTRYSLRVIL